MLTFAVGLFVLAAPVVIIGMMLDEVWDFGVYIVVTGVVMACVALTCLAGCVFYYGVHP